MERSGLHNSNLVLNAPDGLAGVMQPEKPGGSVIDEAGNGLGGNPRLFRHMFDRDPSIVV
jgi:hypothetical protein